MRAKYFDEKQHSHAPPGRAGIRMVAAVGSIIRQGGRC